MEVLRGKLLDNIENNKLDDVKPEDINLIETGLMSEDLSVVEQACLTLGPIFDNKEWLTSKIEMLLEDERDEVRYTILESISWGIRTSELAQRLLDKVEIKETDGLFVKEFIRELKR